MRRASASMWSSSAASSGDSADSGRTSVLFTTISSGLLAKSGLMLRVCVCGSSNGGSTGTGRCQHTRCCNNLTLSHTVSAAVSNNSPHHCAHTHTPVEEVCLLCQAVAALLADVHQVQCSTAQVGECGDGLHLNGVALLKGTVKDAGSVQHLCVGVCGGCACRGYCVSSRERG